MNGIQFFDSKDKSAFLQFPYGVDGSRDSRSARFWFVLDDIIRFGTKPGLRKSYEFRTAYFSVSE